MKIIDIPGGQGSQAWHQHRRDHRNASDTPAMMGCSPYKTRTELLRELATGITADVAPDLQRRFDDGHRSEALARPLAEAIVGEDLYAIVKANGHLSASLDGETLMGDIDWEHKRLNSELRSVIPVLSEGVGSPNVGKALPLHYRVQMEHQLHCSGAEKTLFTASEWDDDGELVDARHCWYTADRALRARIIAGWAQFDEDLAAYVPSDAAPVVVAAAAPGLPAVSVRLDGALVVASNLPAFGQALRAFIDRIPTKPSTDQEFADTDAACKALKKAEEALTAAEASALASIGDVEAMRRLVADFCALAKTTRLAREKMVEARKLEIKNEIAKAGYDAIQAHITGLNRRLDPRVNYLPVIGYDFPGVIKGLRTIDSLRNAVDTELARAKIEANDKADKIGTNLDAINAAGAAAQSLFADRHALVLKDPEAVAAIVAQRLAEQRAADERRLEAERQRIRAEEAARLQREAAEQAAQQAKQQAQQQAQEAAEAAARVVAEAQVQPAGANDHLLQDCSRDLSQALASKPDAMQQASAAGTVIAQAASSAEPAATMTVGQITARLAPLSITADGLQQLGFSRQQRAGPGAHFLASDWDLMRAAIIKHVQGLA